MSKKIVLLSAVLAVIGAGVMFFAHRNAEAKVCFVTDGDCGSEIEASIPNVEACSNLNYDCSAGNTTNCNYKNNSDFVSWINSNGGNANDASMWNDFKCPLNQDYWMYCPKGFRLACSANYQSTLTCGQYKNCKCKDEFRYSQSYYNGNNGPSTADGADPCAQKCHARGDVCADIMADNTYSNERKYAICTCETPYTVTRSQCEEANAQVANENDFCQPSSNASSADECSTVEKYYKGCVCPPEYQYTVASCDGEVGGLKCTNENNVDLWTSCFNCEGLGFYAAESEINSHVTLTTRDPSLGANPAVSVCVKGDETCMNNFTSSTVDNHTIYNKATSYEHAYATPSDGWPQVLWNDLAKYSYLQCPLQGNQGLYNNYYIVDCAEPGMRPSTSSDLKPDGVTYYHDGEACVPDSCVNVVKTILRTDEGVAKKFGLFYPEGVNLPDYAPGTILPEGKKGYLVDGNGKPIVERYINSEGGGYLKTGFDCPAGTMCAWSESWNSASNTWTAAAGHPDNYNYTDIKGPSDQEDNLPARRIAIVLNAEDYGYATDYIEVEPAMNYEQNLNYCTRQVCSPDGTEAGPFYRVSTGCADGSSGNQGGDLCAGHGGYMIKTGTSACNNAACGDQSGCTGANTCRLDIFDTLKRFVSQDILETIIPSAHAEAWVSSHAMICYARTGWSKVPFWKFAGDSDVIKGNYGKNENQWVKIGNTPVASWPVGQGVCGGVTHQGDQCVTCHRKHVVKSCLGCDPMTASSYNNCLATASTAPDVTTAMQLQSQDSGFCFETKSNETVKTYVGLKGVPADTYISVKKFYNIIENTPTSGAKFSLTPSKKNAYKAMLERSCKINPNDPNPKIQYNSGNSKGFPADDAYDADWDEFISEQVNDSIMTFDGIDLHFHGETYIPRQFNFSNGTITADDILAFAQGENTYIADSVMSLTGSKERVLPANIVDTDINFCGTLTVGGPGMQHNLSSSDGSHIIQKLSNCTGNAIFFVKNTDLTSNKYKYVVDKFRLLYTSTPGGNVLSSNCNKIAFLGEKNSSNPDILANSMEMQGSALFDNMYITSSNVSLHSDMAGDLFTDHKATFINMKNSTLKIPNVSGSNYYFTMGPGSAIGALETSNELNLGHNIDNVTLDIPQHRTITGIAYVAGRNKSKFGAGTARIVGYGGSILGGSSRPVGGDLDFIEGTVIQLAPLEIMCKTKTFSPDNSGGALLLRKSTTMCVSYGESKNYKCDATMCQSGNTSYASGCKVKICTSQNCVLD